jgi:hypothetical protein
MREESKRKKMNKNEEFKKNGIILFFFVLIILGATGYMLYLIGRYIILDEALDIITILLLAIPIFVVASVIPKFIPKKGSQKPANQGQYSQVENHPIASEGDYFSNNSVNYNNINTGNTGKSNVNNGSKLGKVEGSSQNKSLSKNLVPLLVFIVVFLGFYIYQDGFFQSSDPVGRWIFEMNEGEDVGGAINLTDYWYMEFYEDGTLEIGWKNVDVPEEEQGTGTWYQSENIVYFTINYNYGDSVTAAVVIKNNELVDAETDGRTGYIRD